MDPLSSVLSLLNPRSALPSRLEAGGDWAIRFPAYDGIKFNVVLAGRCWLDIDPLPAPIALQTGDCYLLTDGRPYRLASNLQAPAIDAATLMANARDGVVRHGGDDTVLMRGKFTFDPSHAPLLMEALAPVIHLPVSSSHASVVQWTLRQLWDEMASPSAGTALVVDHLSHLMLIRGLRAFQESGGLSSANWLTALSHPGIGVALTLMHEQPEVHWTLQQLAQAASMSRSKFAQQFKTMVGMPPLSYLTQWRMRLAMRWLRQEGRSVGAVAEALGYGADSAFSHAFKRATGMSPKRYQLGNA